MNTAPAREYSPQQQEILRRNEPGGKGMYLEGTISQAGYNISTTNRIYFQLIEKIGDYYVELNEILVPGDFVRFVPQASSGKYTRAGDLEVLARTAADFRTAN